MYRGFKLPHIEFEKHGDDYITGILDFVEYQANIEKSLKKYIYDNDVLDASQMQSDWFPQIEANVFISHSHKDEAMAISLAGWLDYNFGIKSFIDSCIWKYADDLLKLIDNEYCKRNNSDRYDYKLRNYSTSHVHMMLSTALSKMIDKTECLFFLNTPNSVIPSEEIKKTSSPWIYHEIAVTQLVEKKAPFRHIKEKYKNLSEGQLLEKSLQATYTLDLKHLTNLTLQDLRFWSRAKTTKPEEALDMLYALKPPKKNSDILHG